MSHETHCCIKHGCKYGDEDCPVELGKVEQEYPCYVCGEIKGGIGSAVYLDMEEAEATLEALKLMVNLTTSEPAAKLLKRLENKPWYWYKKEEQ